MKPTQKSTQAALPPLARPRLAVGPSLLIAGLQELHRGNAANAIPAQWQRFALICEKIPAQVDQRTYGVCFERADGVDYLAGLAVSSFTRLPKQFHRARLPAYRYAIFSHSGHVSTLNHTCRAIFEEWLPGPGRRNVRPTAEKPGFFFECYGENFDPKTGLGDIEVWVPIQLSQPANA